MNFFTSSDGLTLAYQDEGTGLPVLCLAGLTRNGGDFTFVAPHLKHVRLIRLDSRGRGQSAYDPDWKNYNLLVELRDAVELLDHLGLEKVAILGTSRGGILAMMMAALHKDRLSGVVLNDIGPELDQAGLAFIADYIGIRPSSKTYAEVANIRPLIMEDFRNVAAERWREEARLLYRETPEGLDLRYDANLKHSVLEAMKSPPVDLWPFFDALDGLPLGLLRGENSNLLKMETADRMRQRRPDMIFANVADRGHVPFLDEPESLNVILNWLRLIK